MNDDMIYFKVKIVINTNININKYHNLNFIQALIIIFGLRVTYTTCTID